MGTDEPGDSPTSGAWARVVRRKSGSRLRLLTLLAALAISAAVAATLFIDEGEVAKLTTSDRSGRALEISLWIVEPGDGLYVRAPSEDTDWLLHLREHPEVRLARGGRTLAVRAVPLDHPTLRDRVNVAMAEKYGRLDWLLVHLLMDRSRTVPVRLDPVDADAHAGGGAAPGGGRAHLR